MTADIPTQATAYYFSKDKQKTVVAWEEIWKRRLCE